MSICRPALRPDPESSAPEGHLISVAPVPGPVIRLGDEVLLTVSCGPLVVSDER
jgi:beta-lactam-binding protein with PASTA domain